MPNDKVIFWVSADDIIIDFLIHNKAMQKASLIYDFYFLCSGNSSVIINEYYKGKIIQCENNMSLKGKLIFDELKGRNDYGILVRLDSDSIIMNLEKLIYIVRERVLGRHAIIGNVRTKENSKKKYVRGGCNAISKSCVDGINMKVNHTDLGTFDSPFNTALSQINVEIIDEPLFEQNDNYGFNSPVWHPPQIDLKERLVIFKKHQNICA